MQPSVPTFFLRRRTIFVTAFFLAWLVILELVWVLPALERIKSAASELSLQMAENARANVGFALEGAFRSVEDAALDIALEPERADKVLTRLVERNPAFVNGALVDRNGTELARAGAARDGAASREYAKMSTVYLALAGTPNFGEVYATPDGTPNALLTVPVKADGAVERVLVVEVSLESLGAIVQSLTGGRWNIYVTDGRGVVIITSDGFIEPFVGGETVLARPVVQRVLVDGQVADGLAADDAYVDGRGKRVFAVGVPIPLTTWGLFVERDEREAFAERTVVALLAGMIFLLGLLALAVALWSYWRLSVLNERLREILAENEQAAKLLVARDLELNEKNARLQELDEMKSDFVSVAAHQLRTPITGIRWSFYTLLDGSAGILSPDQEKIVRDGMQVTVNAIELINDLLNVARVEEGRFGYQMEKRSLAPLVESAVQQAAARAREKGITLTADIAPEVPEATFDREKMAIVIDNLLENAIKYTPPGGRVTMSLAGEGARVRFSVSDTGIGIPKAELRKVFTKFFRADNAMLFQTTGTGLGLYMVKNIIEKHGGEVMLESEERKGTTVTFTLPAAP